MYSKFIMTIKCIITTAVNIVNNAIKVMCQIRIRGDRDCNGNDGDALMSKERNEMRRDIMQPHVVTSSRIESIDDITTCTNHSWAACCDGLLIAGSGLDVAFGLLARCPLSSQFKGCATRWGACKDSPSIIRYCSIIPM